MALQLTIAVRDLRRLRRRFYWTRLQLSLGVRWLQNTSQVEPVPFLLRDARVAPHRVLAALESLFALLLVILGAELLLTFALELVRASREERTASDMIVNNLLVGVLSLLTAALLALGARSLVRQWRGRWVLQAGLGLAAGAVVWFLVAG